MNLIKRNPGNRTRSIYIVTGKDLYTVGYRQLRQSDPPTLTFSVMGQDGVSYTIDLDNNDIKAIDEARQKYDQHFK